MLSELVLLAHLLLVQPQIKGESCVALATHSMSLENRYGNGFVNDVFKNNILLTVKYTGENFTLQPGQAFAFHDKVLPQYKDGLVKTTNAHFIGSEGYKSDGWLIGDGVCHLASLIHWVAKDAGLTSVSLRNHDFANIPEVPKEYGVSIMSSDANQNLYIINNLDKPVTFSFDYNGTDLIVSVVKTV